jgi:hypothetical protein
MAWSDGGGAQECQLQFPELLPVEHLGGQVDMQLIENPLDVGYCFVRIPAIVDMYGKRPQSEFLDLDGQEARVHSAADPDDAIVFLAMAPSLHLFDDFLEQPRTFRGRQVVDRRPREPGGAVIAESL